MGQGICKDGRERYYDYVVFDESKNPTDCKKRGQELQLQGMVGVEFDASILVRQEPPAEWWVLLALAL